MTAIITADVFKPFHYAAGASEFFVVPLVADDGSEQPVAVLHCGLLAFGAAVSGPLHASVYGADRPGLLAYMTDLFFTYGVNVEGCFGKRMMNSQGSQFEFDTGRENTKKVRLMFDDLMRGKAPRFAAHQPAPFDRVFDLDVRFPRDGCGLLSPAASFLAGCGVNLRFFEARKVETGGLPGFPEVRARGTLELPPGLDHGDVFGGLRKATATPRGTFLELKELYRVEDGRVVKGTVVLSV